ncbi:MAG: iron-containing alcohol dehydrogenase [Zetaproteobacteria bacterium]|nr:iron-containing alcohol dehydrogenase [Zetaproteobacteria bacterium]
MEQFRFPTDIRFGCHSLQKAPQWLHEKGFSRPLVVTDQGLVSQPFVQDFVRLLQQVHMNPVLYADAQGNPVKSCVMDGVKLYQDVHADSVILIGGGCAMDVGKAIALMVSHPGDLFDYEDGCTDARPVDRDIPFMMAIPTTAGTGSEVGGSAVISDDLTRAKVIVWSPRLIPNLVVADPALTIGLPTQVTITTGIDALVHNIEAFLAKSYHPLCDGIALEGIFLIFKHLPTAVEYPQNLDARQGMLMAAMMGAVAFQKGLGVTHSCAHALSTRFDLHHGLGNALMLLPCLEFNLSAAPDKFARMGQCIGLQGDTEQQARGFITALAKLYDKMNVRQMIPPYDMTVDDALVQIAFEDPCHQHNPRVCTVDDFRLLFEKVMQH